MAFWGPRPEPEAASIPGDPGDRCWAGTGPALWPWGASQGLADMLFYQTPTCSYLILIKEYLQLSGVASPPCGLCTLGSPSCLHRTCILHSGLRTSREEAAGGDPLRVGVSSLSCCGLRCFRWCLQGWGPASELSSQPFGPPLGRAEPLAVVPQVFLHGELVPGPSAARFTRALGPGLQPPWPGLTCVVCWRCSCTGPACEAAPAGGAFPVASAITSQAPGFQLRWAGPSPCPLPPSARGFRPCLPRAAGLPASPRCHPTSETPM